MALKRETLTLEQLLEKEQSILMDSGVVVPKGNFYANNLYPYKHFSELDSESLNDYLSNFISMENLIRNPQVYTVQPVNDELTRFGTLLGDKLAHMNRTFEDLKKGYKHIEVNDLDMARQNQEILSNLSFTMNRITKYSKRKIISLGHEEKFISLAQVTYRIAALPGIKIDYSARYGEAVRDKPADLHADEELAATALYYPIAEGTPCAIFTGDSDIQRIVNSTILDLNRSESFRGVKQFLATTPVRVYFSDSKNDIHLTFDTSKPETYF